MPGLRRTLAGLAGLTAIAAGATVVQAGALASAVSAVVVHRTGPAGISGAVAALVLAMAVRAAAAGATEWLAQTASLSVRATLRQHLLETVARAGARNLDRDDRARIAAASTSGIDSLDGYVTRAVPALVGAAVVPPIVLIAIGWTNWLALALLLATLPLVPLFMALIGIVTKRHMDRRWAQLAKLSGQFLDLLEGLTTLKVYGRSRVQVAAVREGTERLRRQTMATLRVAFASGLVLDLLATLAVAVVAVTVGLRLAGGHLGLAAALTVLLLAPELFAPIRAVGAQHHATEEGRTVVSTVMDLMDRFPEGAVPASRPSDRPLLLAPDRRGAVVRARGIEVHHPGRPAPTLAGVDLDVRAGVVTVLTGPSGAGKSTLISVLLGQLQPAAGTVRGVGSPLWASAREWRSNVAWLPQRPRLTSEDVAAEVRLGDPDLGAPELARILTECSAPAALTPLGEDGRAVSAGQRRRIALARAVARAERIRRRGGVPLVLLDEPTEDLDPGTAAVVRGVIARLAPWAAVVVAAHDPSLTAMADIVVRVGGGRLEEIAPAAAAGPVGPGARGAVALAGRPGAVGGPAATPPAAAPPVAVATAAPPAAVAAATPPPAGGPPAGRPGRVLGGWVWAAARATPGAGRRLGQAAGLSALTGLSGLGLTATAVWLICRAAEHPNVQALAVAVVGVRTFAISKALLRYGERLASHDGALRLLAGLRARVFSALEPLAPAGLGAYRRGDLLRRFTADVDGAQELLVRAAVPLVGAGITAAGAALLCALLDPAAGAVLASGCAAAAVTTWVSGRAGAGQSGLAESAGRRDALANGLLDGLDELIAYDAVDARQGAIAAADRDVARHSRRSCRAAATGTVAAGTASALTLAGVLLVGASAVTAGRIEAVDLGVLAASVLVAFDALGALPAAFAALGRYAAGLARVDEVLTRPVPVPEPADPEPAPALVDSLAGRRLDLAPAPGGPIVVVDADLTVTAGQRVAVVGPSGSGKSTLLTAALAQLAPVAGRFEIRGGGGAVPVTRISSGERPRLIAGSLQGDHVFATTLRDNLRFVAPDATDEDLDRVAQRVGLGPFVASLPDGWSTHAGPGGANLSGGQRQRLLLARAVLADPQILVLDEPTAHLDAETERAVMADLLDATSGRTVLLSTHRAAPMAGCDQILHLSGGRLGGAERPSPVLATASQA